MAAQVAVYKALNRNDLYEWTDGFYKWIGGDYERAWKIITEEKGHGPFIEELKR